MRRVLLAIFVLRRRRPLFSEIRTFLYSLIVLKVTYLCYLNVSWLTFIFFRGLDKPSPDLLYGPTGPFVSQGTRPLLVIISLILT